jgi:hypothetical protein
MNIVPSLVEGYMYSEMMNFEGGSVMSGGFPIQAFKENSTGDGSMTGGGGGIQLANLVIPAGLVCDMRVAPVNIQYIYSDKEEKVIDDQLHDSLYEKVAAAKLSRGSRKKMWRNAPKQKSLRIKY